MAARSNKQRHLGRENHLTATNSYLTGCVDLITHIQHGGRLTDTDFEVALTADGRRLADGQDPELLLQIWKGKHRRQTSSGRPLH